jgi:hypothetical protein
MRRKVNLGDLKPTDVFRFNGTRYTVLDKKDVQDNLNGCQGVLIYDWRAGKVGWSHYRQVEVDVKPVEYGAVKQNTRFTLHGADYMKCNGDYCVKLDDAAIHVYSPQTKVYPQ